MNEKNVNLLNINRIDINSKNNGIKKKLLYFIKKYGKSFNIILFKLRAEIYTILNIRNRREQTIYL